MKYYTPIILLLMLIGCKSSKVNSSEFKLFYHVDSLIVNALKYNYNGDSYKYDDLSGKGEKASIVVSRNPEPFLLLDGVPILKEDLKTILIKDVDEFLIIPREAAIALYGIRAKNGAIILITK